MNSIALLWLLSTIYSISEDCPNVIQLAFGIGLQTGSPNTWKQLQGDCCGVSITCDGSQRVTEIRWRGFELNGTINGTAIPSTVTDLNLGRNDITGPIPNSLPSGLVQLWLDGNQMSGDLPFFPNTIEYLYLGFPGYPGNHFSGTLRLNRPTHLYINYNWITDVVIQNSSLLTSWCDFSRNPLLGNPNIANLKMCLKSGLYSASLLPITRILLTTMVKTSEGGAFLSIHTPIDSATESTANRLSTVALAHSFVPLNRTWTLLEMIKMISKVVVGMILIILAIYKTPWKRALQSKMSKQKGKGAGNMLLTHRNK